MTKHDFDMMMEDVDNELRTDNVRIDRRQFEGFARACKRLHLSLNFAPLKEPAIAGKYEGDSLSAHILEWFERRYGDRLNMDFSVAHVIVAIREDPWRLYIPRIFGRAFFVCDRRLADYRGRPSFYSDGRLPVFNMLNGIQDLPDGLAESLTDDELKEISSFYALALESTVALEEVAQQPLAKEARDDLRAAVEYLLSKPTANCALSKWSSLQFIEKLMKAFLGCRSIPYAYTHKLSDLAALCAEEGLFLDAALLDSIQCSPSVRYDSKSVSLREAIAAHHNGLRLAGEVARAILGRKQKVQCTVQP